MYDVKVAPPDESDKSRECNWHPRRCAEPQVVTAYSSPRESLAQFGWVAKRADLDFHLWLRPACHVRDHTLRTTDPTSCRDVQHPHLETHSVACEGMLLVTHLELAAAGEVLDIHGSPLDVS